MPRNPRAAFTLVEIPAAHDSVVLTLRTGFTLVEVLVVLTIIVVLISLLVPAVDRAKYQAELVLCGTRMRAAATGATTYAGDHKRMYPARDVIDQGRTADQTTYESQPIVLAWDGYDDRPRIEPYISMKVLGEA